MNICLRARAVMRYTLEVRPGGVVDPSIRFRGVMNTGIDCWSGGGDPWCKLCGGKSGLSF